MDIKYLISVDATGAVKSIEGFDKAVTGAGKSGEESGKKFGSLWKQFAVGDIVANALKKTIGLLRDSVKGIIDGAIEAEETEAALSAALETTGRAVDTMLPKMLGLSGEMMKLTKYTDEEVTEAQTLLTQLTNLDREGIERATKGAIGLAAVMKVDLQMAALTVTKAMEGNYQALNRIGIRIDENLTPQQKQVELLRQTDILYLRATATMDTFGGKLTRLKNWFKEIGDNLGKAITKNASFKKEIDELTEKIITLIESGKVDQWADGIARAISNLAEFAERNGPRIVKAIEFVGRGIETSYLMIKDYGDLMKGEGIKSIATLEAVRKKSVRLGQSTEEVDAAIEHLRIELHGYDRVLKEVNKTQSETGNRTGDLVGQLKLSKTQWLALANVLDPKARASIGAAKNAIIEIKTKLEETERVVRAGTPEWNAFLNTVQISTAGMVGASAMAAVAITADLEKIRLARQKELDDWQERVQSAARAVESVYGSFVINTLEAFRKWGEGTGSILTTFGEALKNVANDAIDAIEGLVVETMLSAAKTVIAKKAEAIASAIASVLKSIPFPLNLVLVGGAIAATTALFSKIKLGEGAIFLKPTELYSKSGQTYEMGEGREPEVLAPLSKLPAVAGQIRGGPAGRGDVVINLVVHSYLAGEKVESKLYRMIQRGADLGKFRLPVTVFAR